MQRYLAVDFWLLISTQMPQPPSPPPGITTNSLLGSRSSAVDTQPIQVGAAWSHVSSNLESSICGPCSLLALAPFGRLVFWQIVRLPLISWFQGGWRVFQVIWNRQRDSGGDLLIAKRKTQSIVVYSSTSRIREALKNVFFRNSSKTDGPPQEDVFKCTKCTIWTRGLGIQNLHSLLKFYFWLILSSLHFSECHLKLLGVLAM